MDTTAISPRPPRAADPAAGRAWRRRWIGWIDATARRDRANPRSLLAVALIRYAEAEGLPAPPPRI